MKLTTRGFTLVELMIVIAIIGILAAALFPSMTNYLKRSRDAARTSHLKDISTAIGAYYADKERYPDSDIGPGLMGCVNSGQLTTNYLAKGIPTDPVATNRNGCGDATSTANGWYAYGSGTSSAGSAPMYVLGAMLENTNGGNTGTTHMGTGAGGIFGISGGATRSYQSTLSSGLTKGAGQGYVLSN